PETGVSRCSRANHLRRKLETTSRRGGGRPPGRGGGGGGAPPPPPARLARGAGRGPPHAEVVGQAAADAGVALAELRPAGGGGLEQLFLTLTAGESTKEAVR
ncbi:ABC transporter ATP-binding protein, partial [Micromonospora profundi]